MNAQSLAEPSLADALQPLQRAVKDAGSSLSLPNVFHKVAYSIFSCCCQSFDATVAFHVHSRDVMHLANLENTGKCCRALAASAS